MERILVALDGSELAERGLTQAAALARRMKSLGANPRIFLAQAVQLPLITGVIDPTRLRLQLLESARDYLGRLAEPLRAEGLDMKIIVCEGPAAAVLLEIIEERAIDLGVMATHGRTGVARWVLGSVAEVVAERSPVPVLLVPRDGGTRAPSPEHKWHILLPLDDSPVAEGALAPTVPLARALAAEVRLLRVLMPAYPGPMSEHAWERALPSMYRKQSFLPQTERYLEEHAAHLRRLGLTARWSLAFGSPAEGIAKRVERYQSDIVVLPRRARPTAKPWPGGNVPRRLLRAGKVAVLFVTPTTTTTASAVPVEASGRASHI